MNAVWWLEFVNKIFFVSYEYMQDLTLSTGRSPSVDERMRWLMYHFAGADVLRHFPVSQARNLSDRELWISYR